jgi:hypothetical protein
VLTQVRAWPKILWFALGTSRRKDSAGQLCGNVRAAPHVCASYGCKQGYLCMFVGQVSLSSLTVARLQMNDCT